MGRLFWKFFIFFWLAQLATMGGVGLTIWFKGHSREAAFRLAEQHRLALDSAAATLRHGGTGAFAEWARDQERKNGVRVFAIDATGRELLGRSLPRHPPGWDKGPGPQEHVSRWPDGDGPALPGRALAHTAAGQVYHLLLAGPAPDMGGLRPRGDIWHSPLLLPLLAGGLASLVFAALLAVYVAKPIRSLRTALAAAAAGDLNLRLSPLLGARRDGLADLGRDFDRMAQQLQSVLEGQRRLLHDVSHELRSPLARLQACVGLLRQAGVAATIEPLLQRLERESMRIDELIDELLTLARLDAGLHARPREVVDLFELLHLVAEDARLEGEHRGISIVEQIADLPALEGDAALLHRAFDNIVRNAVKYSPAGAGIDIKGCNEADRVLISVADRGPGVAEAELERIFEPFYRASDVQQTSGHGLGLAIARKIVQAHGGTIVAMRRNGGGLEVHLQLPRGRGRQLA